MVLKNTQANRWLAALSPEDLTSLDPHLRPRAFAPREVLYDQGDWLGSIHFIETGFVSSVIPLRDGRAVEACMIGNEGFTGIEATRIPARSSARLVAQAVVRSRAIDADVFRRLVNASPTLQTAVAEYDWRIKAELEQSIVCNAIHTAELRFAKWLLRCHDRVEGEVVEITQESLAIVLGMQRTTINQAAQSLQARGAIRYARGKVAVADRDALEAAACECYSDVMATGDRRALPAPAAQARA